MIIFRGLGKVLISNLESILGNCKFMASSNINNVESRYRRLQYTPRLVDLFHATSLKNAICIVKEGKFRPGKNGFYGAGIYFSTSVDACRRKSRAGGQVVLKCSVNVGNALKQDHGSSHGVGDRPDISDSELLRAGYDSVDNFGEFMLPDTGATDYRQIRMDSLEITVFQYTKSYGYRNQNQIAELERTYTVTEFLCCFGSIYETPFVVERCPNGHRLEVRPGQTLPRSYCDECREKGSLQMPLLECRDCNYDICRSCVQRKSPVCRCGKTLLICFEGENTGHTCDNCKMTVSKPSNNNYARRCGNCDYDLCSGCGFFGEFRESEGSRAVYCTKGHRCQAFVSEGYNHHRCNQCSDSLLARIHSKFLPYKFYRCALCDYDECQACVAGRYDTPCYCGGAMVAGKRSQYSTICNACGVSGVNSSDSFFHCARGHDYDFCGLCQFDQSYTRKAIVRCPKGHICEKKQTESKREGVAKPRGYTGRVQCDECRDFLVAGSRCKTFFHCGLCKYDCCDSCTLRAMI